MRYEVTFLKDGAIQYVKEFAFQPTLISKNTQVRFEFYYRRMIYSTENGWIENRRQFKEDNRHDANYPDDNTSWLSTPVMILGILMIFFYLIIYNLEFLLH